jgi:hypothetical protein
MPKYYVDLFIHGKMTYEVEAADASDAQDKAFDAFNNRESPYDTDFKIDGTGNIAKSEA